MYETVSTEKNDFLLVHAGLGNFDKDKNSPDMPPMISCGPGRSFRIYIYFDDVLTAFGHTPTMSHGKEYTGKIGKTRTWIDIGVAYGQKLVLLRLDDLREFYFS